MEILGMNFACLLASLSAGSIPEKECVLPLLSKILGYAIVAASTTVKVPQIYKILKHNSVRGLSVAAFELEVVGYTIALSYCLHKRLPFSAYGELVFLLIQGFSACYIFHCQSSPNMEEFHQQKYGRTQLSDMPYEHSWLCCKSFHQLSGKCTNKCDYGFSTWHCNKWHHPESDTAVPEATSKEREENTVNQLSAPYVMVFPARASAKLNAPRTN